MLNLEGSISFASFKSRVDSLPKSQEIIFCSRRNYLKLERCRSGSKNPGSGLYKRQGAERRSRGVEGCRIRNELNPNFAFAGTQAQCRPFPATHSPTLRETGFLNRLANQLKINKSATCRRAIQRILVRMKEHCERAANIAALRTLRMSFEGWLRAILPANSVRWQKPDPGETSLGWVVASVGSGFRRCASSLGFRRIDGQY